MKHAGSVVAATLILALGANAGMIGAADLPQTLAPPATTQGSTALSGPQIGAPAPAFTLSTLAGKTVSLQGFRGKTLVVNVWATWCPPCRQEMPDLIRTARTLHRSGVAVLGVDTTENAPIVRAYVAAKSVPYPQAIDAGKAFANAYDVQYFPTTYVIDPHGILRARYIDVIGPAQLNALVAAANAGRSADIASPLQAKIDASLAPARFAFTGAPTAIEANAKAVDAAIAGAEKMLDDSDAATGNPTDPLRTRAEEATIRDRAIASLSPLAPADTSLLPRMRGDAARDREQWQAAIDAYTAALAIDPKNDDALGGLAMAGSRLKKYDLVVDADTKLAAADSANAEPLVELARAQASAGDAGAAYETFGRAVKAAQDAVDAQPHASKPVALLAWTHLYFGRTYAKAGDAANARAQFAQTVALAATLPAKSDRRAMYLEEGQEALVALGLNDPHAGASVSLVPWTGADLPGSIPSTIKYRLVVAGSAGRNVALAAAGVPKGWVASFCSDRVCAPFRVSVAIPESGVKIVEFQLVPPTSKANAPKVRVTATDGTHRSTATT